MIVVDASAVAELLVRGPAWRDVADRVLVDGEDLHAPHLVDLELASVLRRSAASGSMSTRDAAVALALVNDLCIARHAHRELLPRIWALRENLTPYDAAYVALAEALDAPLLTLDARLAGAPGHEADVELLRR